MSSRHDGPAGAVSWTGDGEHPVFTTGGGPQGGSQASPDGKWISFLSDRDGWDHLYVMPASDRTVLVEPQLVRYPGPDGRMVPA